MKAVENYCPDGFFVTEQSYKIQKHIEFNSTILNCSFSPEQIYNQFAKDGTSHHIISISPAGEETPTPFYVCNDSNKNILDFISGEHTINFISFTEPFDTECHSEITRIVKNKNFKL